VKVIVVTPAAPHPFGDTAARWFYVLIAELVTRGHQVSAFTATEEPEERVTAGQRALQHLGGRLNLQIHRLRGDRSTLRRKWNSLLRPGSELLQDEGFAAAVRREIDAGYDVLHLEQMSTGWLGLGVARALLNVHFFDAIDWAAKKKDFGDRKALWQAQRASRRLICGIGAVRLLTPRLKEVAKSIYPGGRYWVVPFALDTSLYKIQPMVQDPVVGLIGSMHWEPSRSAAERLLTRIWPLVKRQVPAASLHIAGWNARKYLGKLASGLPGVTLTENLARPEEFFSQVAAMVYAPSRGSGMKVKVMESMAYGVPVVTTWEGVEGIEYRNGQDCWVAESDEEIAAHTVRLLDNSIERGQMREAGRALIESRYSPGPVVDKMMAVYQEILSPSDVAPASEHVR
jgi:polysaccharide biosynthesis protein PslH